MGELPRDAPLVLPSVPGFEVPLRFDPKEDEMMLRMAGEGGVIEETEPARKSDECPDKADRFGAVRNVS